VKEGGVFLVDKPIGPTSFDIVRRMKKIFPREKVGHAGTLDPFASGLLLVLVGKATRYSDFLMNSRKTYEATLSLGNLTDSWDHTGKIIQETMVPALTGDTIESCLRSFVGDWLQETPMYSAKKVGGVPLYRLARKHITIERPRKIVQIFGLELIEFDEKNIKFEVCCSKGTYIRSLGKEIAERLGTVGHLKQLRRLASGSYRVDESLSVEAIEKSLEGEKEKAGGRFLAISEEFSKKPQLPRVKNSAKPANKL